MRWTSAAAIGALVLGIAISPNARATTIIDTTTAPTSNGFSPFSDTGTTTYGEIFTVSGSDNFLTSFSLYLIDKPSGGCVCGVLDFKGYLGAWDGQKVSNILYSSPIRTMTANFTLDDVEFDFLPDVNLGAGQYIAFLSTAGLAFQGGHAFVMPFGSDLPNGGFAFTGNHPVDFGAQDFNALTTTEWACVLCDEPTNVWFEATLTEPVPTPASLPLFATGLGLLGLVAWRRAHWTAGRHDNEQRQKTARHCRALQH